MPITKQIKLQLKIININYEKKEHLTLVECLIALAIACFLLILTPPLISHSYVNWKEEVFLREFEQVMDTAQITAISTGQGSFCNGLGWHR